MPGSQSREVLTMEKTQSANSIGFKSTGGCFIKKKVLILLVVLAISAVIATGLLVYYFGSCRVENKTSAIASVEEKRQKLTNVRLPRHLKPLLYDVKLLPFIYEDDGETASNFSITGSLKFDMLCEESSTNITLHINDIVTYNDTVVVTDMATNRQVPIKSFANDYERQFYIVHLKNRLKKGTKYSLSMDFQAVLNNKLAGFYRSKYTDETTKKTRYMATTQFQATDARRAFPCLDEPEFKAKFRITLGRRLEMNSFSNMPIENTTTIEGMPGYAWDIYQESVPMSTYLVAFIITSFPYKVVSKPPATTYRVIARPGSLNSGQADFAGKIGPAILEYFETYFHVKFPLPKQDMIAIPDFAAGAMENWGLITYRETAMLFDPHVSSASNKQRVGIVVSHELAHQWFGNLVTPSWWTDLWLNEGFASYVEYLGIDHVLPAWRILDQFVTDDLQQVMDIDSLESSHPISIPVHHPDEITEIFDRISYSKGASIIRMMSHFLTDETFRKGLAKYLTDFQYKAAEQDDLWRYLTSAAHTDGSLDKSLTVKMVMDTWTLQMGYPLITVERDYGNGGAKVSQKRFLLAKNAKSTDSHKYSWWVPLTYTNKLISNFESTSTSKWLKAGQESITINNVGDARGWVIFNVQETGYYRVNYDDKNWFLLMQQLLDNHEAIPPINRAQILNDALSLARSGELDYNIALNMTRYLTKERDYIPLNAALGAIDYIETMLKRSGGYGSYKKYMTQVIKPLYDTISFEDLESSNGEYPDITSTYRNVSFISWACYLGFQDCISKTTSRFQRFRQLYDAKKPDNPETQIPPDLKSVVYCNAIKHGDTEDWNFLWEHYKNTNIASEKSKVLSALGCSNEIWILSRYLQSILNETSGIRKQDGASVFQIVARNSVGRYLAWDFLRDRWSDIRDYFGGSISGLARMVSKVTKSFNTAFEVKQINDFQRNHAKELGTGARATAQAVEKTEANIRWMDKNYDTILEWFKNYKTEL